MAAGGPEVWDYRLINNGDLPKLWKTYGRYLIHTTNTSYFLQLKYGLKKLHGFEDNLFTEKNIELLSRRIGEKYRNFDHWFDQSFHDAGFDVMLLIRPFGPNR